ncbi:MAG: hypothetical protein U5K69_04460 [Balneolaceae bacterium]|nr:hypothetical protein [Balneolaceae bacterium]
MICEDFGRSWMDVIGKPIVGNKLCVPRQIDINRRRNFTVKLANRLHLLKRWPKSTYCISDYLQLPNLKLILIRRAPRDVRNSIGNRGNLTWTGLDGNVKTQNIDDEDIDYTIEKGTEILDQLEARDEVIVIQFEKLINETEATLRDLATYLGVEYEAQMIAQGTRWNWMYPKESREGIDKKKA